MKAKKASAKKGKEKPVLVGKIGYGPERSISVRKIDNGYLVRDCRYGDSMENMKEKEFFCKGEPEIVVAGGDFKGKRVTKIDTGAKDEDYEDED